MSRKHHSLLCGHFGTSFEAKRWLSLDPCGCLGVALSWAVHVYALLVLPLCVLHDSLVSWLVYVVLYCPAAILAMSSLFKASTTDPGAVPLGARPLVTVRPATSASLGVTITSSSSSSAEDNISSTKSIRRCHKCGDNYKPARAHHDSITDRCIVKFDHFCPWVNNAIGALNHKFFCLFLMYTAITCLLSLLLLLLRVVQCGVAQPMESNAMGNNGGSGTTALHSLTAAADPLQEGSDGGGGHHLRLLGGSRGQQHYADPTCDAFYQSHLVVGLFVASLLFLIFTVSMGVEQLDAVHTGKGKIARMKMSVGATGTEFARVSEEFNEMFGGDTPHPTWHWFLPLAVWYPRGMKKVVLGYDWDESSSASPSARRGPYWEDGDGHHGEDDHELQDLERGMTIIGRATSPSNVPLVGNSDAMESSSPESVAPPLPLRSGSLHRAHSTGSTASLDGRIKNRRPTRTTSPEEQPREVV